VSRVLLYYIGPSLSSPGNQTSTAGDAPAARWPGAPRAGNALLHDPFNARPTRERERERERRFMRASSNYGRGCAPKWKGEGEEKGSIADSPEEQREEKIAGDGLRN